MILLNARHGVLSILKFYLSRSIGCNPIELNKIYVPIAQKTTIYKNKENIKKKLIFQYIMQVLHNFKSYDHFLIWLDIIEIVTTSNDSLIKDIQIKIILGPLLWRWPLRNLIQNHCASSLFNKHSMGVVIDKGVRKRILRK